MALIVGLGNPGPEYAGSRHNIGYELIDAVADVLSVSLGPSNGPYLLAETRFKGEAVQLIKPLTFMNRSGQAVKRAFDRFRPLDEECLICYDDIHLDPGKIRIRPGGSAGGHNGLSDILTHLGSDRIPRLRIGIGNQFDRGRLSDYVLSTFSPDERIIMDETMDRAADAVLTFIRTDVHHAMNKFN